MMNKLFKKRVDQIEKICNDLDISFSLYNKSEIYQDFCESTNNSNVTNSSELSSINSKKELTIINSKILDYMNSSITDPNKKSFHQLVQLSIRHLDNFIQLKILVNSKRHLNNCNELVNQIKSFAEQHDEDPAKLFQSLLEHQEKSAFA
ncbi:19533_t:CDS:2, partial [Racocetra persica]